MDTLDHQTHVAHTANIVEAYLSKHHVPVTEIADLFRAVHDTIGSLGQPGQTAAAPVEKPTPAQVKKSIQPDSLTSFLDGKPYKTLKRHLTTHGHTPDSYRHTFGLPSDYPMTAASYSEKRSTLAKQIGLGSPGRTLKAVA